MGDAPAPQDAVDYAEALGNPDYPIVSDADQAVFEATEYDGRALPGKCVLSPEMEILECTVGHGNQELFATIRDHAGGK